MTNEFSKTEDSPLRVAIKVLSSLMEVFNTYAPTNGIIREDDLRPIATSDHFKELDVSLKQMLASVCLETLLPEEKLPFFLNLYNALMMHSIADRGFPKQPSRYKHAKKAVYNIGGLELSILEIEYCIIRNKTSSPIGLFSNNPPKWKPEDPKCNLAIDISDARVNFALNYGCASSVPMRIYTTENLDNMLNRNAKDYLETHIFVDLPKKQVTLPKIMDWYQKDYGQSKEDILEWLAENVPSLKSISKAGFSILYDKFDWSCEYFFLFQGDMLALANTKVVTWLASERGN